MKFASHFSVIQQIQLLKTSWHVVGPSCCIDCPTHIHQRPRKQKAAPGAKPQKRVKPKKRKASKPVPKPKPPAKKRKQSKLQWKK